MLAKNLHEALIARKKTVAFAESCTGGALAASMTAMGGASKVFLGSIVAYSNDWKEMFLGVSGETLRDNGAVSQKTAHAMAEGLLQRTKADFVAAVTGALGPSGAPGDPPIGTVFIAIGRRGGPIEVKVSHVSTDRSRGIEEVVQTILADLLTVVSS